MTDPQNRRIVRMSDPQAAIDEIRRTGRLVVTFSGFSGTGYEDESARDEALSHWLGQFDPATAVVCSGATAEGIGAVYPMARARGFDTIGIVSSMAEKEGVEFSDAARTVFVIDDETWGGYIEGTRALSPTSSAMVGATDVLVCIGGGSIARDEFERAQQEGKDVHFVAADMNHALAVEKARRKGASEPDAFGGALARFLDRR